MSDASSRDVEPVEMSRDELVAEADQMLDLSGGDQETSVDTDDQAP